MLRILMIIAFRRFFRVASAIAGFHVIVYVVIVLPLYALLRLRGLFGREPFI